MKKQRSQPDKPQVVKPTDQDEIALRKHLEEKYRGLREDRSTCSYALEFLLTAEANLVQHQRRTELAILIHECEKLSKWAVETLTRAAEVAKEIKITSLDVKEEQPA